MPTSQNSVGIFTTDANLIIQLWDEGLSRLTNISASTAVGQHLTSVVPDLNERGLLSRLKRTLEVGSVELLAPAFHHYLIPCAPVKASNHFEKMQQHVTIAPLRDGDLIAGLIVTIEDVTERLESERELAEQLARGDEPSRLVAAEQLASDPSLDATPLLESLRDESWRVRRAAVRGVSRRAAPDAIAALLKSVGEDHQNPALLNSALQVLASSDVDTLSPLLEFLRGPDSDLRMQAALALGDQRDIRAISALIAALDDDDINVRYHAIEALGKMQATEAVDALIEVAETRDFFLAFPALEALASIGDAQIAPLIVPFLEDDLLREPAAKLLGQLGNEQAVSPLVRLLNTSGAPAELVAVALTTLYDRFESEFGEGEYIADLARGEIAPAGFQNLLDVLEAPDTQHLRPVALVLGWMRGGGVRRALTRMLGRPEVREEILEALVRHGSGTVKLLIEQLDAEDVEVRRAAVIALGRIGDATATMPLVKMLHDDSQAVDAAIALGQIGDQKALDGLITVLGSQNSVLRQAAVAAVNSLASNSLRDQIIPLLYDPDSNVRESAVKIAGYFGYPESKEVIFDLVNDKDERVRCSSIEHIVYFEDQRVEQVLARGFKDDSPKVRAAAVRAMANLESPNAVPWLIQALDDQDMWVRYFSVRSLGRHDSLDSVDALERLVEREQFTPVRIAALEVLGRLGKSRTVEIAARFGRSDEADLAAASVAALGKIDDATAIQPLIDSLRSSHPAVRAAAANSLGQRRENSAWEELQRIAATDSDRKVAQSAIVALQNIGTQEAIGALIALLVDHNRREFASAALADVADSEIALVAQGLNHDSARVRRAVVEVLARMKRPAASKFLTQALDDPDAIVRSSAAHLLGQREEGSDI